MSIAIEEFHEVTHYYTVEAPGFVPRWTVQDGNRTGFVERIRVWISYTPEGAIQGVRLEPVIVRVLKDGKITSTRMHAPETFGYSSSPHRAQWLIARLPEGSTLRAQLVQWVEQETKQGSDGGD